MHPQGKITEKQLKEAIDKIFEDYDLNKNGHLNIHEIKNLMQKSLGKGNVSEAEIKEFLKITDSNGNNQI
jgi:Ca2+-binding EF-hand superfamily protein